MRICNLEKKKNVSKETLWNNFLIVSMIAFAFPLQSVTIYWPPKRCSGG